MINAYSIGFVFVAATAVAGMDYVVQSNRAGAELGELSISEYTSSFTDRFVAAKAEKEKAKRQSEPAKVHLPEAPEGWERREWVPELEEGFDSIAENSPEGSDDMIEALNNSPVARLMQAKGNAKAIKAAREQVWEYVRGDEVIRIAAKYSPRKKQQGLQSLAMEMVATNMGLMNSLEGYAVVQGVPVFRVVSFDELDPNADDIGRPLRLEAHLGEEISLNISANAQDESVRELLAMVDFDGLNAMLDAPLAGVGRDAPVLTLEEQLEQAELAANAHRQGELAKSRELEDSMAMSAEKITGKPATNAQLESRPVQKENASITSKIMGFFSGGESDEVAAAKHTSPSESGEDAGAGGIMDMLTGGGDAAKEPPKRLQLSGGKSCLGNSAGNFCKN